MVIILDVVIIEKSRFAGSTNTLVWLSVFYNFFFFNFIFFIFDFFNSTIFIVV